MKQVLAIGRTNDEIKAAYAFLGNYFGIQIFEQSIDVAANIAPAMKPDLLVVTLEEFLASSADAMDVLQKACPGIPIITVGTPDNVVAFSSKFGVVPLNNIDTPLDEEAALSAVCTPLKMSVEKLKQASANRKTILVVDDDATTLRSFKSMLENEYTVELATSAAMAFEFMEKKIPNLILLDYEMPVMNGKQMLEKIRATQKWASIPVIFVTGNKDKSIIVSLIPLRPSGYLLKPITMDVIRAEVKKVLK